MCIYVLMTAFFNNAKYYAKTILNTVAQKTSHHYKFSKMHCVCVQRRTTHMPNICTVPGWIVAVSTPHYPMFQTYQNDLQTMLAQKTKQAKQDKQGLDHPSQQGSVSSLLRRIIHPD